jgi:hypothetical protein
MKTKHGKEEIPLQIFFLFEDVQNSVKDNGENAEGKPYRRSFQGEFKISPR